MTDKQLALKAIQRLSSKVSLREIRERIEFLAALKEAEDGIGRGEWVSHDVVEKEFLGRVKRSRSRSFG